MRVVFFGILLTACGATTDANRVVMPAQPAAKADVKQPELATGSAWQPPKIKPLDGPTCQITKPAGRTEYAINLYFEERLFATVGGALTDVDVRLPEGADVGTMSLTHEGITLTGQIQPAEISLESPVDKLHQEWLEVRGGPVVMVDPDGTLHARPSNPHFVVPVDYAEFEVPCAEASFFDAHTEPKGTKVMLKDGIDKPLRLTPTGKIVAQVIVPAGSGPSKYNEAIVLERKGSQARVRTGPFDEVSYGWGWIDASALDTSPIPPTLEVSEEISIPTVRCDHDVPIYVHEGDHPLEVGVAKKGAKLPLRDRKAPNPSLDLRIVPLTGPVKYTVQAEPLTEAFVTGESVASCK